MVPTELPTWVVSLDEDDLQLIRRFVLLSGSLKELAADYGVSYPTIRARMDALIEQPELAKELLRLHREAKGAKT